MIKIIPAFRPRDRWGDGCFGASRGGRVHKGVDIACLTGSTVLSHVAGRVTKIGFPYDPNKPGKGHFRYVQVTDAEGRDHRFFYVLPGVSVGDELKPDDLIGLSQGLQGLYPGITDHIHYEVKVDGEFVDPGAFL